MRFTYMPTGVCSKKIDIELSEDHTITGLSFTGGCNGNLKGLSAMALGQKAESVMERLKGIHCGMRPTSCPDQLAHALAQALAAVE